MKRPLYLLATLLLASGALAQELPPAHPEPLREVEKPAPKLKAEPFPLPGGEGGIGLDDLAFPPGLRQVVVPAGRTGKIVLIDPQSRKSREIAGFKSTPPGNGAHNAGPTSADEGKGYLFAVDRTGLRLEVIDPAKGTIVAGAPLAGSPDYVRYVATTSEVWVTEPDKDGIEIFSLSNAKPPVPAHATFLSVPGGPESLVIDARRKVGYANLWKSSTVVIDLIGRKIVETWPNGCQGSRGLALDAPKGLLFVGCAEGGADLLEITHHAIQDRFRFGNGTDIIAYNPTLNHLYVPASKTGQMAIVGVSKEGNLKLLATVDTAIGAHCAVADDQKQVWVCDPRGGQVLVVRDTLAAAPGAAPPGH
ncbi:MAG: YncE family protein [Thermoanaerobaculia bacterium]